VKIKRNPWRGSLHSNTNDGYARIEDNDWPPDVEPITYVCAGEHPPFKVSDLIIGRWRSFLTTAANTYGGNTSSYVISKENPNPKRRIVGRKKANE